MGNKAHKLNKSLLLVVGLMLLFVFAGARAQILIEDPSNKMTSSSGVSASDEAVNREVGEGAATEYFKKREQRSTQRSESTRDLASGGVRVLMLHVGTFINDRAYRWGSRSRVEDPGQANIGVTYRIGEWKNSMDLFFRAEVISYEIDNERPVKLSLMPIVAFPDSRSSFPLYFGAGAGVGIFFKQAGDESDLSADYALLVGARFPEMFDNGGLFFETGLKGQIHLVSSGQQDGVFLAAGYMFSF